MLSVGDLLAVDPGIESPGAALFRDGVLIAAVRITVPDLGPTATHAQRALAAADAIVTWAVNLRAKVTVVTHEWPQIYAGSKSRANPNNLIAMAAVDGAVDCAFAFIAVHRGEQLEVRTFLPAEWAGQLPKNTKKGQYWKSPRGVRIRSRLSEAEWAVTPDQHDAGDAIGLGLKALGRLDVRRVLTTGR